MTEESSTPASTPPADTGAPSRRRGRANDPAPTSDATAANPPQGEDVPPADAAPVPAADAPVGDSQQGDLLSAPADTGAPSPAIETASLVATPPPAPISVRVVCTLENASENISGVNFEPHERGMISEPISAAIADQFLAVPGYERA